MDYCHAGREDARPEVAPAEAWVYVMSYPGSRLLKVGYTRRQPRARAAEIGGTMAPCTPKVEAAFRCSEARRLEGLTHRRLAHCRAGNGSEWFDLSLSDAVEAIEATAAAHRISIEPMRK